MLKNKNLRFGFIVFILTMLSLFVFVMQSKTKESELSKLENIKTQEIDVKP